MNEVTTFIESGILELYVMGIASVEEARQVEEMAALNYKVRREIEKISETLKVYAGSNSPAPNSTIKPMVMASIDYEERLKNGETPSVPPMLNRDSKTSDYSEWLERKDMILPPDFSEIFVKLIGYTPGAVTGIVWISGQTPYEVHTDEHERFLIVEGTCDIIMDESVYNLVPGDYMGIPLHAGHVVKVTSSFPCKVILQRVAA